MQFSLFELAISLLIISLIISSTLFCYNVINSTNLRSFTFEINNLTNKILLFQDKYDFIPGDYPFADRIWLEDCVDLKIKQNLECNGNGNDYVENIFEGFLALKHLSFAGIYYWHQQYDYVSSYAKSGANIASSMVIDSQIQILGDTKLHVVNFDISHLSKNFLRFAKARNNGNILNSIIAPKHAMLIDQKIDDGMPLSGKVLADMGSKEYSHENKQLCLKSDEKNLFFYRKFVSNIYCYLQVSLEN